MLRADPINASKQGLVQIDLFAAQARAYAYGTDQTKLVSDRLEC